MSDTLLSSAQVDQLASLVTAVVRRQQKLILERQCGSFRDLAADSTPSLTVNGFTEELTAAGATLLSIPHYELTSADFDSLPRVTLTSTQQRVRIAGVYIILIVGEDGDVWTIYIGSTADLEKRLCCHLQSVSGVSTKGIHQLTSLCAELKAVPQTIQIMAGEPEAQLGHLQLNESICIKLFDTFQETNFPKDQQLFKDLRTADYLPIKYIGINRGLPIAQDVILTTPYTTMLSAGAAIVGAHAISSLSVRAPRCSEYNRGTWIGDAGRALPMSNPLL